MNKIERQHQIIQLIEKTDEHVMLETRGLAKQLGVSEMTVRRDLEELSHKGLVKRKHGGVSHTQTERSTNKSVRKLASYSPLASVNTVIPFLMLYWKA